MKHDKLSINSNGKPGKRFSAGTVIIPTFDLVDNPTIHITDVKMRRFPLMDRAVQRARQEVMAQEDVSIFKTLDDIFTVDGSGNKEE